ncbi:MAG: hypothetical protein QMD85_03615 [Candidatus Aenigmarchaeota archaeon]|nr:hypothetical protein [Candidatus Aenigmarchaeota archaeon]MDI6722640.1 hypothetical protein [Candidatus Aenigmarchaeota archaeon]
MHQITRNKIFQYYSSEKIASQIFRYSNGREVAGALWDGSYDKRPNMLQFKTDVIQMVRKGITSFHYSTERWSNPMALAAGNYNDIRTGWDIVIDVDSRKGLEESKIAARLVCSLLERYNIKNCGVKFSGRRGFHIILPWEMFPQEIDYKPLARQYPDIPRIILGFIRNKISDDLRKELLKSSEEIGENPFETVEIEKDWGNRHMFRAPFSFNEKTWLVSLPISPRNIKNFSPEQAEPDAVLAMKKYEKIFAFEKEEAADLLIEAIDWNAASKKDEKKPLRHVKNEMRIAEDLFPPCIKIMLEGLSDGRKRSIFTLINFLRSVNWGWDEIEAKAYDWNEKNKPPLLRSIIAGQLVHAQRREMTPPSNCSLDMYYMDIGICRPDNVCKAGTNSIKIKNPISYPLKFRPKKKEKGFSCICGEKFSSLKSLQRHKSKSHYI